MNHCFSEVSRVGHEGLWLLIIWLLGERTWERERYEGWERRQGASNCLWLQVVWSKGPNLPKILQHCPLGPRKEACAAGFSSRMPVRKRGLKDHCPRSLKWTGQEEPGESSPSFSPSPPHCLFHFTSLLNRPTSSHPAVPTLV